LEITDLEVWRFTEEEIYREIGSSSSGLTTEEATRRLQEYGPNQLQAKHRKPIIFRFFQQFTDLFAVLLEVAAILTFIAAFLSVGPDRADNLRVAFAIVGVVILNATIGFLQEFRAEKATEALQVLVPQNAKVIRNGDLVVIPASELVPGDLMALEEGDRISADARIVRQFEMATNNIALTGESDPVRKTSDPICEEKLAKIEMPNLVFMGTSVSTGTGRAVVFATGMETEFGRIFELTSAVKEEISPLQREIAIMARTVSKIAIVTGALLFVMGHSLGLSWKGAVLFALGVMVACVPEGLPATLSVALAVGIQRMAKKNALIKKLSAVETLGSTDVICTDKTGTLTKAEMTVKQMFVDMTPVDVTGAGYEPVGGFEIGGQPVPEKTASDGYRELFTGITFCNNSRLVPPTDQDGWSVIGDPTEGALVVVAKKGGFDLQKELITQPRIYELPFDSVRKRMSVVHVREDGQMAYVKGAPKETVALCTTALINGKVVPFTDELRAKAEAQNDAMSREALRVLAICERPLPSEMTEYSQDTVEKDLTFVGLVGMIDPPRPEVSDSVAKAHSAGIRVIMITGDYGLTAEAIARKIGIVKTADARVVTGIELDGMDNEGLKRTLKEHHEIVFARVSPEHKLLVATALREMGDVVAMTGDGVNDAPALKRADIGVAMGLTGTDVSREAAVMILLDDSFASIIAAVEQGRGVYANLKKMVTYLFSHNLGELFPFVFATVFRVNLVPLTALQVLSIDLASDVFPSLALGTEQPEPGIMQLPPRAKSARLLDAATLKRICFLGMIQSIGGTLGFLYVLLSHGWHWGDPSWANATSPYFRYYCEAITMTQAAIVMSQFANGFVVRTERNSIFKVGLFSNKGVVFGELFGLAIILAISYLPALQHVFKTAPLSLNDWLILIATSATLFVAEETRKWFVRRKLRQD
jgi:magnesium-transporting ATPase (P-type)